MAARKAQSTPVADRKASGARVGDRPGGASGACNWSAQVTRTSNALELEEGVFTWRDPRRIAESLSRSAEASTRRKAGPYRSAMSMLAFYINRAGSNLPDDRRRVLEDAKAELSCLYGKAR
jgi:hypothetical protein